MNKTRRRFLGSLAALAAAPFIDKGAVGGWWQRFIAKFKKPLTATAASINHHSKVLQYTRMRLAAIDNPELNESPAMQELRKTMRKQVDRMNKYLAEQMLLDSKKWKAINDGRVHFSGGKSIIDFPHYGSIKSDKE